MSGLNLSEWAIRHRALVRFLMVIFLVSGVWAYSHLGQKEDPDFTFKAMLVRVVWPGADAQTTQLQVTDRLEKKLLEHPDLDYIRSYTKPGEAVLLVSLRESTPAKDVANAWYQVRKKVGDIRGQLPADIKGPFFNDEFGDTFGNVYAFTADGFSYEELRRYVEYAKREALRLPVVAKVDLIGEQDEKIYLTLDSARLAGLSLDVQQVWKALREHNTVEPAGTFETPTDRLLVRPTGELSSVEAVKNVLIYANGRSFRVGDVAQVTRGFVSPPTFKMRFDGKEALGLAISMKKGGDVIRLGEALSGLMAQVKTELPVGITVSPVSDQPRVVKNSINEFMHSLIEAVVIVLAVSFISLGMRTGVVVALSIPLVLAMTFLAMYFANIDLQRISLGSLIIALGLLVDDAIIAVEMMALKLEQGWTRLHAATFAYTHTAFPMLTGTLITAATFLPVGFAKSNAGEYTFSLFSVVGLALVISWFVAVLFTPLMGYALLREHPAAGSEGHADVYQKPFYLRFRRMVEWSLDHRKTVIAATLLAFLLSIVSFKLFVQQQFFPASSRVELLVDFWLPQSASYEATEREVKRMEAALAGDKGVVSVTSYVGGGSPRFYLPLDQQQQHLNYAQMMVMTQDEHVRETVKQKIATLLDNDFPMARGRVIRLENGPPVGYPVQFRVSGADPAVLRTIAGQVETLMREHPGTRAVNHDWGEQVKALRVQIDQDKARALGLSSQTLSRQLQTLISGAVVTEFRDNDRTLEVVARLNGAERTAVSQLENLMVQTSSGRFVPVAQVATVTYAPEESIVWRRNRLPTITVRADAAEGVQASDIALALWPKLQALEKTLPVGYHIALGGSLE